MIAFSLDPFCSRLISLSFLLLLSIGLTAAHQILGRLLADGLFRSGFLHRRPDPHYSQHKHHKGQQTYFHSSKEAVAKLILDTEG